MSYRDDLTALEARHAALEADVATATKECDAAGRLLEEAKLRAKLPILDNIRVATPCTADWAQMAGDDRVRACGACNKNVYNLSNMTRDEAEALLIAREGSLCVRYFQRADGTILLADCTIGKAQKRKRRLIAAGAAAMLAGGGFVAFDLSRAPGARGGHITGAVDLPRPTPEGSYFMGGSAASEPVIAVTGGIGPAEPVHEVKGDIGPASPNVTRPPAHKPAYRGRK